MYMIKITKDKVEHLAETAEKMLRYGGKLMECLEEIREDEDYGERSGYGHRGSMNYRYPMEDDMDMREAEEGMGRRRGRNSMGRYTSM